MAEKQREMRLDDLLSDPIVRLVMRSDGVNPNELRRLIRSRAQAGARRVAANTAAARRAMRSVAGQPAAAEA